MNSYATQRIPAPGEQHKHGRDGERHHERARKTAQRMPMAAFSRRRGVLLVLNASFVAVRGLQSCHKEQDERGASRAQRGSEPGKQEEMEELKSSGHPVRPHSIPCAHSPTLKQHEYRVALRAIALSTGYVRVINALEPFWGHPLGLITGPD